MLCVIAKIDNAARERLNELCKVVEEFDLPVRYLYGHITLVSYIGQNEEKFVERWVNSMKEADEIYVLDRKVFEDYGTGEIYTFKHVYLLTEKNNIKGRTKKWQKCIM